MDKSLATRQIFAAANARLKKQLVNSEYMKDELQSILEYYFSEKEIANYQLITYNNGFYLGETQAGQRHGYGAYLWYNDTQPNTLYLGNWRNNNKDGEGFYLMSSGICYYGEFVNGEFHGDHSHVVGDNGRVEFEAEFYNGDIRKVLRSNGRFTFNGKSYGQSKGNNSSGNDGSDSHIGCFGLIIIIAVVFGIFKFCTNCTGSPDTNAYTGQEQPTQGIACTAHHSSSDNQNTN